MPRWVGLLGSWALLVLAMGILLYAVAAEAITISEARKLHRVRMIDRAIEREIDRKIDALQRELSQKSTQVTSLQSEVASTEKAIEDLHDSSFVITVSTTENMVYAHRNGQLMFKAMCSTGKNTTFTAAGHTRVFRTPIGRFRIQSKETNPVWVPPDWHFHEEARKWGLDAVRLQHGERIADLYVRGRNVYSHGYELPAGKLIVRSGAVVIPPVGTRQREFEGVLGTHRLNLGDGYALHGTEAVGDLGRPVSHGCVRLHNADIAMLYEMANLGDEVVIY